MSDERTDLSTQPRPQSLRPGIRTFKPRRSRITPTAQQALADPSTRLVHFSDEPLDLTPLFGRGTDVVLEIGFGDGRATEQMALDQPSIGILAIDVHTPGVGELLARLDSAELTNVRVMEADAIVVLERMIAPDALAGVRSYFPDPWPKARHHKRRLVQPAILDLVRTRVRIGGTWHLATDWSEYAEAALECFGQDPRWRGGVVERPAGRPVTRYERRALRDGRPVTDLIFTRTA
jgi:tRNA (guanine-N7-)-methyltransferase